MTARTPDTSAALLVVERVRLLLDRAGGTDPALKALRAVDARLKGPEGETRARLQTLFGLTAPEIDALDCALAVAVEPALGPRIADVQGMPGRNLPTSVALRLLFGHGPEPLPRSGSALLTRHLVRLHPGAPGEPAMIEADPAIVEWYFGLPSLAGVEGLSIARATPAAPLAEWQIEDAAARVTAAMTRKQPVRVLVTGLAGSGRAGLAAALAAALGKRAILVATTGEAAPEATTLRRGSTAIAVAAGEPLALAPGAWTTAEGRPVVVLPNRDEGRIDRPREAGVTSDLAAALSHPGTTDLGPWLAALALLAVLGEGLVAAWAGRTYGR